MMKRKLIILNNQTSDQRFLGISLEDKYEVAYVDSVAEALDIAKQQQIDGFLFDLPPAGLNVLKELPASLRLFCVVSPTREPPVVPADSAAIYFLPLPFSRLELRAVMQKAFGAEVPAVVSEKIASPPLPPPPPPPEVTPLKVVKNEEKKTGDVSGLVLSANQVKPSLLVPFSLVHNTVLDLVHGVKNPLVSIQTFAQMLPEKIDDQEFRENFSRFVTSEINLINTRLNQFLDQTSLPLFTKEKFPVESFIDLVKQQLSKNNPQLRFEVEPSPDLLIKGNCEKLTEAVTTLWSIILDMVEKPQIFFINCGLVTYELHGESPSQNNLELYFTLKFTPQYIDMELDFLSTAQRPKGVEILHALRLIEEMSGSLNITKADKNTFTVKISLPVCPPAEVVKKAADMVGIEEEL